MKQIFLILWLAVSTSVRADTLVAPPEFANTESPGAMPFFTGDGRRAQQVFAGSYFTPFAEKGGFITELRFRVDGAGQAFSDVFDLEIRMSTTQGAPDRLSRDMDSNHGADVITVLPRTLVPVSSQHIPGGPNSFSVVIPLPNRFGYSPAAGNLLLEMNVYSDGASTFFDATGSSSDGISLMLGSAGSNSGLTSAVTESMVTQFVFEQVPEPSSVALMALGGLCLAWKRRKHVIV